MGLLRSFEDEAPAFSAFRYFTISMASIGLLVRVAFAPRSRTARRGALERDAPRTGARRVDEVGVGKWEQSIDHV